MASEKQIAANRANAKKSTGPRTAAGKSASSQNAFRHGLSAPLRLDPAALVNVESLARDLAGQDADPSRIERAAEFVLAQLELKRIEKTRQASMALLDIEQPQLDILQEIAALDRYERYAQTRRRRAMALK